MATYVIGAIFGLTVSLGLAIVGGSDEDAVSTAPVGSSTAHGPAAGFVVSE